MLEASYATGSPVGEAGRVHDDLSRLVPDLVAGLPYELVTSRVHLSALVLGALGPLPDDDEQSVLRAVTARRWRGVMPVTDVRGRFRIDGPRWPDVVEIGRLPDLEGAPMPLGSLEAWGDRGRPRQDAVAILGPRLDPAVVGTREQRAELLVEHGLWPGLLRMGVETHRAPRGIGGRRTSSDLVSKVLRADQAVLVNVECRNRRWEVLDRPTKRDRFIFGEAAQRGVPSVVAAPRVTKRFRSEVDAITNGFGGVVETGVCVAPSQAVIDSLSGWTPWPMVLHLPDDVIELVVAEIEAAADRYLAAGVGPQVVELGMLRVEDQELLGRIQEYRWYSPKCSQAEVAAALGIHPRKLRRVWSLSGERWDSSIVSLLDGWDSWPLGQEIFEEDQVDLKD